MAKSFDEYYNNLPLDEQAEIQEKVLKLKAEMPLAELRAARQYTQKKIATVMDINQASVSKMEKQTDMYLSTVRKYVEALGGKLHIVASFQDGDVELSSLENIELNNLKRVGA